MKKVIFITGASSGLGKATSLFFAAQDWNVVATMRNLPEQNVFADQPNIFVTKLDVSDGNSIRTAITKGIEKFGQIDVLINNAGYGQQGIFEAIPDEKIREQFEVNVFGLMEVTRAMLPHFRSRKQGMVVNITSGVGRVTVPLVSIYAASKFAVEGFSEALSYELESQNIRVKVIEPGYVATKFHERAAAGYAHDVLLEDYNEFSEEMSTLFSAFGDQITASTDDVAKSVYDAVNDGTHTLRYVVGPDLAPLIALKTNNSDQDYIDSMRSQFMPNGFKS